MDKVGVDRNKEPWLAASLSWLLPGIGHLYSGAYCLGTLLLVLGSLIYISWIMFLISTWTIIIPTIILKLSDFIVLPIYASWNAFRLTRGHNTEDFERERTVTKDPWLAVFLSVLLPGLGHLYFRKWIIGILLFLGLFIVVYIFHLINTDFMIAVLIYRAFVSVHACVTCQLYKIKTKKPFVLFIIVYISICFLRGFLLPELENRFVHISGSMSGTSMNPTLVKGDRFIVNSIIYSFNYPKPGDVVGFQPPKKISDMKYTPIKRIVAIGGETIEIRGGGVYVDGKERNFSFQTGRVAYPDSGPSLDSFGKSDNPYLTYCVDEPYHVPEDHFFVLGDNRRYSVDSRCFGAISRENIIGKVVKIYWPPRRMGVVR